MTSAVHKMHSIDELKSLVTPVAEKYGVDKVYLFGSVARGDADENSDYDFCIELGEIRSLFVLGGLFMDLRDAVGNDIDLVDKSSANPELLNAIMREGVVLYEG